MNTVIEVNNVSKTFGKNTSLNQVLNGACMFVQEGEFVSLMGDEPAPQDEEFMRQSEARDRIRKLVERLQDEE